MTRERPSRGSVARPPSHRTTPTERRYWRTLSAASASYSLLLRICQVPQTVANEVQSQHEKGNREAGDDCQMRRIQQVRATAIQHRAPARRRRLNAEA